MCVAISLSNGMQAWVDEGDVVLVSKHVWHPLVSKSRSKIVYARAYRPRTATTPQIAILMHRLIMGEPPGLLVDHRDRDGLMNIKSNLRICTGTQNQGNQISQRLGTSQYKGVSWHSIGGRWLARIGHEKVQHYLGLHSTQEEAALAYDAAARRLFGEFALTNF